MSDFNPSQYLTKLYRRAKTADGGWKTTETEYLEVKWRLLWLRTEQPQAVVSTEIVKLTDDFCCVCAVVSLPDGGAASGIGSETAGDWKDFIEKAETKALGRALAALGFGTQFCEDYDFAGGREDAVVDAPVQRPAPSGDAPDPTKRYPKMRQQEAVAPRDLGLHATEPQLKAIYAIARSAQQLSEAEVEELVQKRFGCLPSALSRSQASTLIDALKLGQVAS